MQFSDQVRNIALGNQLALSSATNTDEDREWTISDQRPGGSAGISRAAQP